MSNPNNQNLGKDFLLLWGDAPAHVVPTGVAQTVPIVGGGSGGTGGGGGTPPVLVDMLTWVLMPPAIRAAKHMTASGSNSYHTIDTDAGWPVGYPANTFVWVKNVLGYPGDWVKYSTNWLSHWITENTDSDMQAACVAAGSLGGCWGYQPAYKRYVTPVRFMPRFFDVNGGPVTVDTPGPNSLVRTTDCEATSNTIPIGDVRGITYPPVKMTWAGDIDVGAGPNLSAGAVIDNVNGVPTIQHDYLFGGTIASNSFVDLESTYYVQGYGRVAWVRFKKLGGIWTFQQMTRVNILANGITPPSFSCGAGKPWWL
jgi:hypothetical protein